MLLASSPKEPLAFCKLHNGGVGGMVPEGQMYTEKRNATAYHKARTVRFLHCIECQRAKRAAWRLARGEREKVYYRQYYQDHRQTYIARSVIAHRKSRAWKRVLRCKRWWRLMVDTPEEDHARSILVESYRLAYEAMGAGRLADLILAEGRANGGLL